MIQFPGGRKNHLIGVAINYLQQYENTYNIHYLLVQLKAVFLFMRKIHEL